MHILVSDLTYFHPPNLAFSVDDQVTGDQFYSIYLVKGMQYESLFP